MPEVDYKPTNDYNKVEISWSWLLELMEAATNTVVTDTEYRPELDEWTYFFDGSPLHGTLTVDSNNRIVGYTLEANDAD